MQYLIVGLGNIGPQYELTRHNIGFLVLDHLASTLKAESFKLDKQAYYARASYKGRILNFIKPTTYMNLSGKAVRYWMQHLKIPRENILVITDDIAIPFGTLRMKGKGSGGGHNGLGNIQETLGTTDYPRLRFGVGDDFPKGRQVDYVLGNFSPAEMAELPLLMDKAVQGVLSFCTVGLERSMNVVNTKEPKPEKPEKPKTEQAKQQPQNSTETSIGTPEV
jgi:PTH1 family peptidyl-tRNA hydrolase